MSVFPKRLQPQEINPVQEQEIICLLFVLPASIKTDVEVYCLRRTIPSPMCLLEREVSIFLLSRFARRNNRF